MGVWGSRVYAFIAGHFLFGLDIHFLLGVCTVHWAFSICIGHFFLFCWAYIQSIGHFLFGLGIRLLLGIGTVRWAFYCVDLIQPLLISPSRFRIVTTLIFPMTVKTTIILSSMKTRAILWTLFFLFTMLLQLRLNVWTVLPTLVMVLQFQFQLQPRTILSSIRTRMILWKT